MRHLMLDLCYRGTAYHGFQVQQNARTITQTVQDAVERVFGRRLDVKGCSRTDAGVHANHFALCLRTDGSIPCDAVVRAMNVNLPVDIAVRSCREVSEDFHPRYSCTGKRYLYLIHNSGVKDPFGPDLALQWRHTLDERVMDKAAGGFLGTHDFAAFCSAGSSVEGTVRTIFAAAVRREGERVIFSVTGDGFLYNMVRIMAGTLLDVTAGKIPPDAIPEIIAGGDRTKAGFTAPAHGLYLDEVYYNL